MIPCIKGGIYFSRLSYHQILPETGLNSTHFFLIQKTSSFRFFPLQSASLRSRPSPPTRHTGGVSESRVGSWRWPSGEQSAGAVENRPLGFLEANTMKIVDFPASYVGLQECKVFFCVFFERTHRNAELSKHLINNDLILILIYSTCTCFSSVGVSPTHQSNNLFMSSKIPYLEAYNIDRPKSLPYWMFCWHDDVGLSSRWKHSSRLSRHDELTAYSKASGSNKDLICSNEKPWQKVPLLFRPRSTWRGLESIFVRKVQSYRSMVWTFLPGLFSHICWLVDSICGAHLP